MLGLRTSRHAAILMSLGFALFGACSHASNSTEPVSAGPQGGATSSSVQGGQGSNSGGHKSSDGGSLGLGGTSVLSSAGGVFSASGGALSAQGGLGGASNAQGGAALGGASNAQGGASQPLAPNHFNLTGFATVGPGTTGGGVLPENDPAYAKVTTPLALAQAVRSFNKTGAIKVIEIMNDLDLGWMELGAGVQALDSNPFTQAIAPKLHPRLMTTGVSKLDIKYAGGGLTIFSATGVTLRHVTLNIKSTNNIIVRNLRFDEMWEWDEASAGAYDKNDWDFIDLGNGGPATNVWIDHCTFTKTYDGIVDVKGGSYNITFSWNTYVGDDGAKNPNSFVRQQLSALEANSANYPMYNFLRTNGFSVEDLVAILQGQDKTHLLGSNPLDPNNAVLNLTYHHQLALNLWDRNMPRLRAGNVHGYNLYADDTGALVAKRLRDARVAAMSAGAQQTIGNTYSFNPPLNGSISTEGGAILVEKSVYRDCLWPLRNNQTDVNNPAYTGKILGLDVIYHMDNADNSVTDIRGNSTDANSPLGPFQAAIIPFSWNLQGNVLPYTYTADDPAELKGMLEANAGAGVLTWERSNWLKTTY